MIDEETVFILGSGSSKPYGFPTDADLRMRIIEDFSNDYLRIPYTSDFNSSFEKFERSKRTANAEEFIERLRNTQGTATIDEFISINKKFECIGKTAIQHYLLEYERNYLEYRFNNYDSDWFEIILSEMLSECKKSKNPSSMDFNKVSFLTFNYDRLIEYLFTIQFISLFKEKLNDNKYRNTIYSFIYYKIIHLFGSIGKLTSIDKTDNPQDKIFGEVIDNYEYMKESLKNIKLIKDGLQNLFRIKNRLKNAKKIFFLGVGYIENNMKLLDLESNLNFDDPPQIYSTAYGKSSKKIKELKNQYFNFNKKIPTPIIEPLNCKKFLEKYF